MRFLIISHAVHKIQNKNVFSYAPYVREMNLWLKHVDDVFVIAPIVNKKVSRIEIPYIHDNLVFKKIPNIKFTSPISSFFSVLKLPYIILVIFIGCLKADHIHLRCPGNIGLLGCLVQFFFPKKVKTVKYAGNWDPNAKQPLSYRFQKWLLSNTFLTKNTKVLVYGKWENQSHNIKPFFTATFKKSEIEVPLSRSYSGKLKFIFVGSLVKGKRPLFSIKIVEALNKQGKDVFLDVFGDGALKAALKNYIKENKLNHIIKIHGNKTQLIIKESLIKSHFLILPSKSEGWPKVVAEAMFFGIIPIVSKVSCVPFMLDYGNRGILIDGIFNSDLKTVYTTLKQIDKLKIMSINAANWSQLYTLDRFESNIIKLLKR